jgi:hypothetical protein
MDLEIALVEWLDVSKVTNGEVFDKNTSLRNHLAPMKTIGWILNEDDYVLLLVQEFDGEEPRDWIAIPKCLITKITLGK